VIGLGSLLALLFLPGIAAMRRSDEIYHEIRRIDAAQRATQKSLAEIERRLYLVSIAVREALLDTSPVEGMQYRTTMAEGREAINRELTALRERATGVSSGLLGELESELGRYWNTIDPVFRWTPEERAAKGMYFLREQQRPRRQSILAIANSVSGLAARSYQKQYEEVTSSQRDFREDLQRIVAIAFLLGVLIAAVTVLRISVLERRSAAERTKAEAAEEKLRTLSTQLMHAQEEERKSISRELHDEVGQMLTALRMQITALERSRQDDDAFREHVREARGLAEQSLRSVRDLAVGLRPSVLDLGLVPALQWQARNFSRSSGLRVTVHVSGELEDVPEDQRICVYRVVQESLTNAARHAGAKNVDVHLERSSRRLLVRIQDDGSGFRASNGNRQGIGVVGMQERVRELGGVFRVETQSGHGTAVVVELMVGGSS
jgi:signal transduction histidine kinase